MSREVTVPKAIKDARRVSTPLIAVTTPDQPATVGAIVSSFNGKAPPILRWDIVRGIVGANTPGLEAIALMGLEEAALPGVPPGTNPTEALTLMEKLPTRGLLLMMNAHLILRDWTGAPNPAVVQAILNLRDEFKATQRTLVLLGPSMPLTEELQQDVMVIDEPLPSAKELTRIVLGVVEAAKQGRPELAEPDALTIERAVEALKGLAAFPADQATALCVVNTGTLDAPTLWQRKRSAIEQTPGLKIDRVKETFADIGGSDVIKAFAGGIFDGPEPPDVIIRVEEIEKVMAGASGEAGDGGVAKDSLGVLLTEMEDNEWCGLIAVGPPGSGKSLFSKTLGATYGRPTLMLDLNATRGKYVGQSEQQIRTAMKVIKAMAGTRAYFVATCNGLESVKPELRRRFTDGIWFFDLPTDEERECIWNLNLARFGYVASTRVRDDLPNDDGWTGAEIRNCCRLAYRRKSSMLEAARFIVPVVKSDPGGIERLRRTATGAFLSASYEGIYRGPQKAAVRGGRFMEPVQ